MKGPFFQFHDAGKTKYWTDDNGQWHSDNRPAAIDFGYDQPYMVHYYHHGKLHRINGPSKTRSEYLVDGGQYHAVMCHWYVDGEYITATECLRDSDTPIMEVLMTAGTDPSEFPPEYVEYLEIYKAKQITDLF